MTTDKGFMQKIILLTLTTGILLGIGISTASATLSGSAVFVDVPSDNFANDAIGRMEAAGIVKGVDPTHFDPNGSLTRAQAAVLFDRMYTLITGKAFSSNSSSSSSSSITNTVSSSNSSSSSSAASDNLAGLIHFSQHEYNVYKNDPTGSVEIHVSRLGADQGSVTVNYAFTGGTAVAGKDYQPMSGTLTFDQKVRDQKLLLPIYNNTATSGTHTVNLTLSNPTGGASIDSPATSVVNINDPNGNSSSSLSSSAGPTGPVFNFSASEYTTMENGGPITITVIRTGDTATATSINYTIDDNTAVNGRDYTASNGILNFAAGQTTQTFTVTPINNNNIDGMRRASLMLTNPANGATVGNISTATLAIADDESIQPTGSGSFKFASDTYTASRSDGYAYISVALINSEKAASVNYATQGGTAVSGTDYTYTSGTLNFAAGETKKVIAIPILNTDGTSGATIGVQLSNPTNGPTIADPSITTITLNQ